jgi:hypothetical protein
MSTKENKKQYDFELPQSEEEAEYTKERFQELLQDRWWRLNNLYYIKNEDGDKVLFKPSRRKAQRILHENLWFQNIIPKARQLGITTFFTILYFDQILFSKNITAGIIAHRQDDAQKIFKNKIKFAWDHLHPWLKHNIKTVKETSSYIEFDNGSSIFVDLSTRSGTIQLLHISEFGYVCQKHPDKAEEIVTGSLNSVHSGNIVSIESTARGREGYFHDFCMQADELEKSGKPLTDQDFKLFFFPWYMDPKYSMDDEVVITDKKEKYFNKIENKNHISLTEGQKKWYVKKENRMGHKMKEEFPSSLSECFEANTEGSYYGKYLSNMFEDDRITRVPHESSLKVDTYWDIGMNDFTVILLVQQKGLQIRIIDMYWNNGEGMSHYTSWLDNRRREKNYRYGRHYLPHDAEKRSVEGRSTAQILKDEGLIPQKVCERTGIIDGINKVRSIFGRFLIDNKHCDKLIKSMRNYRKEWNDKRGVYKDSPLHDENSHFCDPLRLLAMEYREDMSGGWNLSESDLDNKVVSKGFFQ